MTMLPRILTILLTVTQFHGTAARYDGFRHEAVDASQQYKKRFEKLDPIVFNSTEQCPAPTHSIYSLFYPSPDATAIAITAQSQVVTSFLPEMTWCVGPPIALQPVSIDAPYLNQSTEYEVITAGTGHCETVYVPTETTVCATTLTGIASKIIVSECDQQITFSSECGFTLETPLPVTTSSSIVTPAPTVKRMMTYWLARWQSLTAGNAPSDVDIKICTIQEGGGMECIRYQEVWEVFVVTKTITTQRDVQLTTTVTGPGTLIIETLNAVITDTVETIDLSTSLLLETEIETESTSKGRKLVTRSKVPSEAAASTLYITKHVKYKTQQPESVTTIRITYIVQALGTITRTRPRSRPRPTLLEIPDF